MSGRKVATLGCPRCHSLRLTLTEVCEEFSIFDSGPLVVVDGRIHPTRDGVSEPGEIQLNRSRITCQECGRSWHPRRPIGDVLPLDEP